MSKKKEKKCNWACPRNLNGDYKEVVQEMNEALSEVETGEITTATRSVMINGVSVKKGEVISLLNGKLVHSSRSIYKSSLELLKTAKTEEKEHITIFYGSDVENDMVDKFTSQITIEYPDHELEIHYGGQPHYQFIISIE